MTQERKKVKKDNENLIKKISITLLITLISISIINVVQVSSVTSDFDNLIQRSIEEQKPAQITLTIINPNCDECFDINVFVDKVSSTSKTNITSTKNINLESNEAQTLIAKYNINKFPALIVEGNLNKSSSLINTLNGIGQNINEKTYVLTPTIPLYTNKNGEIIGKVSAFAIDNNDCLDCDKSQLYIDEIKKVGVKFSDVEIYDINSQQGKQLISKYNLDKVPNIVFSSELGLYPQFKTGWEQAGSIEEDGSYVLRELKLPYYSLSENRLVGALDFTYVYDSSCTNCFDAKETYDAIFAQFGISANKKTIIDLNENISLVEKYNIKKIPALIINGDTSYYQIFDNWGEVGTIEEDTSYVFRTVDLIGLEYKTLD